MNGDLYLHVAGCPNHRGTHGDEIPALFAKVGEIAAGSYGILYTSDDEDPERQNEFRVFRLARGELSEHPDSLLSPRFPTIEDE